MTLAQELTELLNTEIAVMMNDGQGYRGILVRFDNDVLVLETVYETSTTDVDWIESKEETRTATIKGYVPWRRITLPRVIIRIPMVLRIWPWMPLSARPEPGAEPGKAKVKITKEKKVKKA